MTIDLQFPPSFWLIGCGNMAGAMLRRWLDTGLDPAAVTVIRPSGAPVAAGVRVVTTPRSEPGPSLALLAVKPQKLDEITPFYRDLLGPGTILVSILAGVELAVLRDRFPRAQAIVRAMPNTPVATGHGVVALCGQDHADAAAITERLMRPLGLVEWIDESLFDPVAALTASGPAFVFRFIDALAEGAAALGIPQDQARRLATATVEGAGILAASADVPPSILADRVASPGGMTRQGLDALDSGRALSDLVHRALKAASDHSRKMGEAARRG